MSKTFEEELQLTSLAAAEVVEEIIPEVTDTNALKEIITLARILVVRWDRVRTLAERHLEVIEEVERILCKEEATQKIPRSRDYKGLGSGVERPHRRLISWAKGWTKGPLGSMICRGNKVEWRGSGDHGATRLRGVDGK